VLATLWLGGCAAAVPAVPTTSPSGIPYVDEVIEAVESGNPQSYKNLFVLRPAPCTTERGLLRQPLCGPGQSEGTPVETLPMLSSDLGHLTVDEIISWQGMDAVQLYAVYRTGPYTYRDEYFPAGEYAVAFVPYEREFAFILQVTEDGIVRIDYCGVQLDICQGSTIEEIMRENESAFVVGPLPRGE
jgi:hypothetical protein